MENSTAVLNDLSVKLRIPLTYQFEMIGDFIEPLFKATCTFKDQEFTATGQSKKLAKSTVSKIVLSNLTEIGIDTTKIKKSKKANGGSSPNRCSTSDKDANANNNAQKTSNDRNKKNKSEEEWKREIHEQFQKLEPEVKWKYFMIAKKVVNQFQAICVLKNGKALSGYGPSKKASKFAVIKKYFCEKSPNASITITSSSNAVTVESNAKQSITVELPNVKREANVIEEMILEKFDEIKGNLDPKYCNFHNLAGIVLWDILNPNKNFVLTITAGSICLPKKLIGGSGHQLHDMHAEVLARRALLSFLYNQLKEAQCNRESMLLFNGFKGKFQLNPRYEFHLYINSAPCGNARIFNPTDEFSFPENDLLNKELRIKLPYDSSSASYFQADSVFASLSCSDKILKWNLLGVQGALLGQFLMPIYFKSIVIGSLFSEKHINRALYGRIEDKLDLTSFGNYSFKKPNLFKTSNEIAREVVFSITKTVFIYYAFQNEIETFDYTQCNFFKNDIPPFNPSECSKFNLFRKYLAIKSLPSDMNIDYTFDADFYEQCKQRNSSYQNLKSMLYNVIAAQGMGHWKCHPGKSYE